MDIRWQMDCCLCCCGPIQASMDAQRRNKVVRQSVSYIEWEAIRNASLWNLPKNTEPTLISEKQMLHLFHNTNVRPVIQTFFDGAANDTWFDDNSPGFDQRLFDTKNAGRFRNQNVTDDIFVVSASKEKRAVMWPAPRERVPGFDMLWDLLEDCIERVGYCRNLPNPEITIPGCKMCNDIMTQEATSSHFLVRKYISQEPLVPAKSILTYRLKEKGTKFADAENAVDRGPNEENMNKRAHEFTYQGCLAYYFHRCLPDRPGRLPAEEMKQKIIARKIVVAFSFLVLEVACMTFERFKGLWGGRGSLAKPAFRYRGCTEMYIAYMFWILMTNDTPYGVDEEHPDVGFAMVEFCQFHRYMFLEVVPTLVECHSEFANAYEINDVIFGEYDEYFLNLDAFGMQPGVICPPPARMLGFICERVCQFYLDIFKPIFSRHMTGMSPYDDLLSPGASEDDQLLYNRQKLVSNKLVSVSSLRRVMHRLENTTMGDIDTYVESVGAHAVFWLWQRLLETAPIVIERLMDNFMNSLTLIEYKNVQAGMSPDPSKPAISEAMAEKYYVMCNALELKSEPKNEREVMELKLGPLRSPPNAVDPLSKIGAFRRIEIEFTGP